MKLYLDKAYNITIKKPQLISDCTKCDAFNNLDNPDCCDGKTCKKLTPLIIDISHRHDLDTCFTSIIIPCDGEFGNTKEFKLDIK